MSDAKKIVGMGLTAIGVLLLAYGVLKGLTSMGGEGVALVGSKETADMQPDALAMIIGWFAILIGPALWFGETPTVIKRQVTRR